MMEMTQRSAIEVQNLKTASAGVLVSILGSLILVVLADGCGPPS